MAEKGYLAGVRLGSLTLEEEIGRGAFSAVYRAKQDDGAKFAVKCPLGQSQDTEQADQRELEVAKTISQHENIVSIYKFIKKTSTNQLFYVLELCEFDLNHYIVNKNPSMVERFGFMVDIARGVNYLHTEKIIHRDLKPQNILLALNGGTYICKITDFGVSKKQTSPTYLFSTVAGTPVFRAPEISDMLKYTFSADVYSLGLIYFVMYTTSVYTEGTNKMLFPMSENEGSQMPLPTMVRRNLVNQRKFVDKHFQSCTDLGELVFSMIQLDPGRRPPMDKIIAMIGEAKGQYNANRKAAATAVPPKPTAQQGNTIQQKQQPQRSGGEPSQSSQRQRGYASPLAASLLLRLLEDMASLGVVGRGSFKEDATNGRINVVRVGTDSGISMKGSR